MDEKLAILQGSLAKRNQVNAVDTDSEAEELEDVEEEDEVDESLVCPSDDQGVQSPSPLTLNPEKRIHTR